jgi:hypothetical protein
MAVPALRQIYVSALRQCVDLARQPGAGDTRGWLEREIDRQAAQVLQAIRDDPKFPFSLDQSQADVDFLFRFARARPASVDQQVTGMQPPEQALVAR